MSELAILRTRKTEDNEAFVRVIMKQIPNAKLIDLPENEYWGDIISELEDKYIILDPATTTEKAYIHSYAERKASLYAEDIEQLLACPCTPFAVAKYLRMHFGTMSGKSVVILNRSERIGIPLALQLIRHGATVTICNSKTDYDKIDFTQYDVIVTATNGCFHPFPSKSQVCIDISNDVYETVQNQLRGTNYRGIKEVGRWTVEEMQRRMNF